MATTTATTPLERTRSLHARRGSASAPDPFALHAALDHGSAPRNVTSTLTIVRVPSVPAEDMGGDVKRRRRRSSGASVSSNGSGRISFAALGGAFTPIHAPQPTRPIPAPAYHARKGSQSSIASVPSRPYTPVELVQLARDAARPTEPGAETSFAPLADDVLLPFLDRPQEVAVLVATPPTSKLFALLAKSLPAHDAPADTKTPPAQWTYSQLERWLTRVDRAEADDATWVASLRACIAPRSESVWERVKGALGVPPELEQDVQTQADDADAFVDIEPVFLDSSPGTPISEDPVDLDAIQGLRILNGPTSPRLAPAEGYGRRSVAHPHVSPRPHFPASFTDVNVHERPPLLKRHSSGSGSGSGSRSASPVPSPGSNYAHFVAQRILNNNSPHPRAAA